MDCDHYNFWRTCYGINRRSQQSNDARGQGFWEMLCRLELESLFYSYSYTLSLLKDCSLLLHGYRSNNLPSFGGAMTRLQGWLPQARKESTVSDQSLTENNSIHPASEFLQAVFLKRSAALLSTFIFALWTPLLLLLFHFRSSCVARLPLLPS
jgi:hypothetical protein